MKKFWYVYIMGNERPTLYIGITNNLVKRVHEHRNGFVEGFTKKYHLHELLYFEEFKDPKEAIQREKQLKHWNRAWKINLIKKVNPEFNDLYQNILE